VTLPGDRPTPHFSWGEMTATSHADLEAANRMEAMPFALALAATAAMLEVVRSRFDRPIRVHSGFRGPSLNAAVGGSATSQHLRGEAADFSIRGVRLEDVADWIVDDSGLAYGQVLIEGRGGVPSWIHLSLGEPWRARERCREAGSNLTGRVRITSRDGLPIRLV